MEINRFGEGAKAVYGNSIHLISDVNADELIDFALTRSCVAYLFKGEEKTPVSIVPDKPEATGLIHFHKKPDGNWAFITADEYEEKKGELPDLCFATRHPITGFSDKNFEDLTALLESGVDLAAEGEPQYCAKYFIEDGEA